MLKAVGREPSLYMHPWNGSHEDEVPTATTRNNKRGVRPLLPPVGKTENELSCESAEKASYQNNRTQAHCDRNNNRGCLELCFRLLES